MRKFKDFLRMLKESGVAYTVKRTKHYKTVIIKAVTGPRNEGWEGMYTSFVFSSRGVLVSVGVWQ